MPTPWLFRATGAACETGAKRTGLRTGLDLQCAARLTHGRLQRRRQVALRFDNDLVHAEPVGHEAELGGHLGGDSAFAACEIGGLTYGPAS